MKNIKRGKTKLAGQRSTGKGDTQLGARIRTMRMDRGLSQEQLGNVLGVSFQQVQKYEKGINRVSAMRLNQIAEALQTTPQELTGFDGAGQLETFAFDQESYKLAKVFAELPDGVKSKMRSLINSILETVPAK